jgi:hypothetical protein
MLIGARSTPHRPCTGRPYAVDPRTNTCYELLGAAIAGAGDIASKAVVARPDAPPGWEVLIELRSAAANRLNRFAVAYPSYPVAIVSGSTVLLAAPLHSPPFRYIGIDDSSWTRADAQRVVNALPGQDITHDPGFRPAPTVPHA